MKWHRYLLTLAAFILVAPHGSKAVPIIDVGTIDLQPDMANQPADLLVTGGDQVEGVNFNLQVADGGVAAGGMVEGPAVTADLLTGTIFESNNLGAFNIEPIPLPMVELWTVITQSGTVSAEGVLARLTFDTRGIFSGDFPLVLTGTVNGDTDFIDVIPTIQNGLIHIVPEPNGMGMCVLLSVWFCIGQRERDQRRQSRPRAR